MNPAFIFLLVELGVLQSLKGTDHQTDIVYDTIWKSTNPGAGGAFGVVGAGPTGVIIVGADLADGNTYTY